MTTPLNPRQDAAIDRRVGRRSGWLMSGRVDAVVIGIYVILVASYITALMIGKPKLAPGPGNIMQGTDSLIYRYAGAHWPWDPEAARVAPLFPWLLTLSFRNLRAVVIVQSLLSVAAWTWLGLAVRRLCGNAWVGLSVFVMILAFSLSPEIIMWNGAIASEGISLTMMVATCAAFAAGATLRR